jgi:hypothetical protein
VATYSYSMAMEADIDVEDLSGGATLDIVPLLTCVCGQPKFKTTLSCVAKCPGGKLVGMLQGQFDKSCQDPKAAAAQLSGLMAKFSGAAGGSKGSKGSKGGLGKGKGKGKYGKGS